MKTEQAISYFKWRFTKSNINTSKKDLEALNVIITALNSEIDYKINSNLNFCKLFIYSFKKMVLTNAMSNNYKQINYLSIYSKFEEILNMDADSHIDSLLDEFKGIEIQNLINRKELTADNILKLPTKKQVNSNMRKMLSDYIEAYGTN